MTQKFNPLTDTVKPLPKTKQSFDLAPDPEISPQLDTQTPAVVYGAPRRFTLGDLSQYGEALYPRLKQLFPHVNDRMYGGWLRGCINDNSCLFVCIDAQEGKGAAGMAFIGRDPLNPVPFIDVLFVIGSEDVRIAIYHKIAGWAKEIGASEIRMRTSDALLKKTEEFKTRETSTLVMDV